MSEILLMIIATIGRRATVFLLTSIVVLAFTCICLVLISLALTFPKTAAIIFFIAVILGALNQFIFAIADAIDWHLPERKSKDE